MEQFSLDKYLENPSRKIVTKDKKDVRIICTDAKVDERQKEYHIIALVDSRTAHGEDCSYFNEQGIEFFKRYELFFADDELTEFEKELEMMMVSFSNGNLGSDVRKEMPKQKLHNYAHRLLDLARKELIEELSDDNFAIDFALNKGKQDALKDLPKWKKITEAKQNYLSYGYLSNDEYYLSVQELKDKLPKEE